MKKNNISLISSQKLNLFNVLNIETAKRFNIKGNYHREIINNYNAINFHKAVNYIPMGGFAFKVINSLADDIKAWALNPTNTQQIFILGCDSAAGDIVLQFLTNLHKTMPNRVRIDSNARAITSIPINVYDWRRSGFTSRYNQSQIKAVVKPPKRRRNNNKLRIYILDDHIPKITTQHTTTKIYDVRLKITKDILEDVFHNAMTAITTSLSNSLPRRNGVIYRYSVNTLVDKIREYKWNALAIFRNAPKRLITGFINTHYVVSRRRVVHQRRITRTPTVDIRVVGTGANVGIPFYTLRHNQMARLAESNAVSIVFNPPIDHFRDIDDSDDDSDNSDNIN
ncbi:hypothetical protein E24_00188 [Faustovirus]|nr:hypothetical protein PRJ_Fausto_00174 [Faustovirus]AMN83119.1 hypothetical protein E24_00188 [Faustovirus]AMN84100.1 hypothetical protein D5a_00187 [Faustovirus]AMN85088.1 hypothetical protein E23_00187 [Faustovirus]QBR99087.1 hypothetical protein [Faustovirus mariensis]